MKAPRAGFTLVEMLVVVAALGVIAGAVAACLAAGLRAWDAARAFSRSEARALVAMRLLEHDLQNAFCFRAVAFSGGIERVSFPVPAEDPGTLADGQPLRRIGAAAYRFDAARGSLRRKAWAYPAPEPSDAGAERLAAGLAGMRLQYRGGTGAEWADEWVSATNLPSAVRIRLAVADAVAPVVMERVVSLPMGQPPSAAAE